MELKLDIYDKKEITKTYTNNTYNLMYGTVEDVLNVVNIDELKTPTDKEISMLVMKAIPKSMDTIKDLLKDIFDGITDKELRNTRVKDIAKVLIDLIKYSIIEISKGVNEKN